MGNMTFFLNKSNVIQRDIYVYIEVNYKHLFEIKNWKLNNTNHLVGKRHATILKFAVYPSLP